MSVRQYLYNFPLSVSLSKHVVQRSRVHIKIDIVCQVKCEFPNIVVRMNQYVSQNLVSISKYIVMHANVKFNMVCQVLCQVSFSVRKACTRARQNQYCLSKFVTLSTFIVKHARLNGKINIAC